MENKRKSLVSGQVLYFENDVCVEIDELIGCGGTALTYYGRERIDHQEPVQVLVKEVFPADSDFYRDHDGKIIGKDAQADRVYDALAQALFYEQELGNRIAQTNITGVYPMKQVVQEQNTGNYYGLFYQCPSSITFRQLVEKAGDRLSLCGKLKLIQSLIHLVRSLHETGGYCHNDISGGNVLIMSNALLGLDECWADWNTIERELQVGLIDFACATKLNRRGEAVLPEEDEPMRFHTEGFSAPELYEMDERKVTVKADVYSVAACLWYLLTGETLETEKGYPILEQREWRFLEKCLRKHELCSLSGDVRIAFGKNPTPVPEDLIEKIENLLKRGLAESWNRFGNMEILEERLQEIINLAEGASVSDAMLGRRLRDAFEVNRSRLQNRYEIRRAMLPVAEKCGERRTESLLELFLTGESIYAIGPGGVGKTTTMFQAAETLYEAEGELVPVYLELNRLPLWKKESGIDSKTYWLGDDDRPMFIEQFLAGIYYGCHGKMTDRNDLVAGALRKQVGRRNSEGKRYVILLDGLNEMAFADHEEKRSFIAAINWYLEYGHNLCLVLTSRYDEGLIDVQRIQRVQVKGLTDESLIAFLKEEMEQGSLTNSEYTELTNTNRNSNLWKCLKLPLFLHMYCRVDDKRTLSSAGEILQAYFHDKKYALDGSRNYSERVISTEKFADTLFSDGLSVEIARQLIIDLLLPNIGYMMMSQQIFYLENKEAVRYVNRCFHTDVPSSVIERYGYAFDAEQALRKLEEAGADKILQYICENMGILVQGGNGSYFFSHQYYRDYFAANRIIHIFCRISELLNDANMNLCTVHDIRSAIEVFAGQIIPESVLMICGECLRIHRTVPVFGANGWTCPEQWDPLVDAMLDACRFYNIKIKVRKNEPAVRQDAGKIKVKEVPERGKALFLEKNLFDMLCLCRRFGSRADLSGIDFSGFSLTGCRLENIIFSHTDGERGIYAKLPVTRTFYRDSYRKAKAYDETIEQLLMHPDGSWVLVVRENEILQFDENVTRTHLEEQEVLGDESRPLGYWDKIEWASYKEDGQMLALLETVTNVGTYRVEHFDFVSSDEEIKKRKEDTLRKVYFYDRKEGRKYSARLEHLSEDDSKKISLDSVLDCKWCGDSLVLLQSTKERQLVHTTIRLEDDQLVQKHTVINMNAAMNEGHFFILNENSVLIYYFNRGVIYQVHSGQSIWFDVNKAWSVCAVDMDEKAAYIICADGTVVSMNTRTGEMEQKRQAGIFRNLDSLKIYKDKIYFTANAQLYQTDKNFMDVRYIKEVSSAPRGLIERYIWKRDLSVGGNYAAVDAESIIRLSDGTVVKSWDRSESTRKLPIRIWLHPKKDPVRVSVLEQGKKVLYQLDVAEDSSLQCVGYRFIELDDQPVYAIYVDYERALLTTCTQDKIVSYDLNTGKRKAEMSDIPLDQGSIKNAAFAPNGRSLELTVTSQREDQMRLIREEHLVFVDWKNGVSRLRPNCDSQGKILRYEFTAGDIAEGDDSGKRNPIYKLSDDWIERRHRMRIEKEEREFYDEYENHGIDRPKWMHRIRSIFGEKKSDNELKLFEIGENWCGMGINEYFYWDGKRMQKYIIQGEPQEIKYFDISEYQIYPFEEGFLIVNESQWIQYIQDHKTRKMERLNCSYWSEYFWLGCPGMEAFQVCGYTEEYEYMED